MDDRELLTLVLCAWFMASIYGAIGSLIGGLRFVREIAPYCREPDSMYAQIALGLGIAGCISATVFFSGLAALAIYVYQLGA